MLQTLSTVAAFALAAWALLAAALNRAPDRAQYILTVIVTASVLAFTVAKITSGSAGKAAVVFFGYAATALLLPIGAWLVAKMEPTRYGSLIVGVGALIVPVLVLRMGQVWGVS